MLRPGRHCRNRWSYHYAHTTTAMHEYRMPPPPDRLSFPPPSLPISAHIFPPLPYVPPLLPLGSIPFPTPLSTCLLPGAPRRRKLFGLTFFDLAAGPSLVFARGYRLDHPCTREKAARVAWASSPKCTHPSIRTCERVDNIIW